MHVLLAILFGITATKAYVDRSTNAAVTAAAAYTDAAAAAKRGLTDMAEYEIVDDVDGAYLAADALPVTYMGKVIEPVIKYEVYSPEDHAPFESAYNLSGVGDFYADGRWYNGDNNNLTFAGKRPIPGEWPVLVIPKKAVATGDQLATTGEVAAVESKISDAYAYSKGVYDYMRGNTNAWFSGTNYPDKATASLKHKFSFEDGMDLLSVPCSMALCEIRDGERQTVWDQRDWVSWYWSFKSAQMRQEIAATNALIMAAMPKKSWGSYTARGLDNPDPSTVYVDTEKVVLSAGLAWETVATSSGCAYWTIVGNMTEITGSGVANADGTVSGKLEIKDFEGNTVMRIVKGAHDLSYADSSQFTGQAVDSQGRVTFDLISDKQPIGEYSTYLDGFVEETDENCPADYEWESLGGGKWRIHFLLKPSIAASSCFARFKVAVERDSTVEYVTAPTISGGLIYNGVKIAPVIPDGASAGATVTWKVVE